MVAMTTLGGVASTRARRWPIGITRGRPGLVLAWSVAVVAPALAGATVALHLVNGATDFTGWWYSNPLLAALLTAPGVLIAMKRPGSVVGWLLCVSALAQGLCGAGREYFVYGALGGAAPGWLWVGWFSDSLWIVTVAALPLILLLFPDGKPRSARARMLLVLPVVAFGCAWAAWLLSGPMGTVRGRDVTHPAADLASPSVVAAATTIGLILIQGSLGVAMVVLVWRYRRSSGESRQQMTSPASR